MVCLLFALMPRIWGALAGPGRRRHAFGVCGNAQGTSYGATPDCMDSSLSAFAHCVALSTSYRSAVSATIDLTMAAVA